MSTESFLQTMQGVFDFIGTCFAGLWSFLTAHPWLLSLVIAPLLITLIVFGVSISFTLLSRKKDERKGER